MAYKNILFDLDGTLTDSSEGIKKCVLYAYEKLGLTPPPESELDSFIGPPLGDSFINHGVPTEDRERSVKYFRERYNDTGKFENFPYPGMIDLLKKLKDEDAHLYVATSKLETAAVEILEHFDMAKYFDGISGATLDESRETKKDVIAFLLSEIGEIEGDVVMVGDTAFDVVGSAEFQIPCIAVSWGFGDTDEMKSLGAIATVHTMEELYNVIRTV